MSVLVRRAILYTDSKLPNYSGIWISPQNIKIVFEQDRVNIKDLNVNNNDIIELRRGMLKYKDVLVYAEPRHLGMFAVAREVNNTNFGMLGIVFFDNTIDNGSVDDFIKEFCFWYNNLDNNTEIDTYINIEDVEDAYFYDDEEYYLQETV